MFQGELQRFSEYHVRDGRNTVCNVLLAVWLYREQCVCGLFGTELERDIGGGHHLELKNTVYSLEI